MPDPVVHFEIPADDVERAQRFYSKSFGWKANSIPGMGYTLFHTTPTDAQGMVQAPGNINGGMAHRQAPIDRLLITVQVADIEAALKAVTANGGQVVRGAMPIPGVGTAAYVKDTEGNTLGLIQPRR
ncbi:MAG TPA: VOC family protein [Candidatus Thermoplasmatota archaeon]|nr:VOC family protein [Candidatus Thermoplasmatota archaeon]